jgi:Ras family protein
MNPIVSGKSSLVIQFVQGQFVDHYEPTIENSELFGNKSFFFTHLPHERIVSAFNKTVQVMGTEYEMVLVDTAGQDEYTIFPPEYSANIHGYVLVYSIDSSKSYDVCEVLHEKLVDLLGNNK